MTLPLGPFTLVRQLASGGMGEVWEGTHGDHPVAIKVLGRQAHKPQAIRALQDEVRAVARLDHPGVVLVLDHGLVSEATESATEGLLRAGSPWLVMELHPMGSLQGAPRPTRWEPVRALLLDMLSALAHAHARQVIHRDLKPSNILLRPRRAGTAGVPWHNARPVITDFGIAHATGPGEENGPLGLAGTPRFMAPEQCAGDWRAEGPWTDLYALGCLAWRLVSGRSPFHGLDPRQLLEAHRLLPLPRLETILPVPADLEAWLVTLLEKLPERRFRRAADAAHALEGLSGPLVRGAAAPVSEPPTMTFSFERPSAPTTTGIAHTLHLESEWEAPDEEPSTPAPLSRYPRPPLPPRWRDRRDRRARQLQGAGLGLWGLRTVPLVGRLRERDRIWAHLTRVVVTGKPGALLLHGPAGTGKTRLATWMAERAHEVGAFEVMVARHGPGASPEEGVVAMIRHHLRLGGATPEVVRERVAAWCGPRRIREEVELLQRLLVEPTAMDARERTAVVHRTLRAVARERPVLVVLDDAQWGAAAVAVAEASLASAEPCSIAWLLTVREGAGDDTTRSRLDALPAERLPLAPLGRVPHAELVSKLLGLKGELAEEVCRRTAGNPLFAKQLVGDWVARGVLLPAADGFELAPGAEATIPDDLHALWQHRVAELERRDGPGVAWALERAAALGQEVDGAEWEALVEGGAELAGRAFEAGLAVAREGGWALVHGMLRESLERSAREGGRWAEHHRACAEMLLGRPRDLRTSGRIGEHLWEAGAPAEALPYLRSGIGFHRDDGDPARARTLEACWRAAADAVGLPPDARERVAEAVDSAWMLQRTGLLDEAAQRAEEAIVLAARRGWRDIDANALWLLGTVARQRGDTELARRRLETARGFASEAKSWRHLANILRALAALLAWKGDIAGALALLQEAQDLCLAEGVAEEYPRVLYQLGTVLEQSGDFEGARAAYQTSLDVAPPTMGRLLRLPSLNGLAEIDRRLGNLEAAERGYREVARVLEAHGMAPLGAVLLNLALVHLARGEDGRALSTLARARRILEFRREAAMLAASHVLALPPLARAEDWTSFDAHLEHAGKLLALGIGDLDVGLMAEEAGDLAHRAGRIEAALGAWRIAEDQWRLLKRDEAREAVAARLRPHGR